MMTTELFETMENVVETVENIADTAPSIVETVTDTVETAVPSVVDAVESLPVEVIDDAAPSTAATVVKTVLATAAIGGAVYGGIKLFKRHKRNKEILKAYEEGRLARVDIEDEETIDDQEEAKEDAE